MSFIYQGHQVTGSRSRSQEL